MEHTNKLRIESTVICHRYVYWCNESKIQTSAIVAISSLLAIAASISGLTNFEAFGQRPIATNATATISNQTGSQQITKPVRWPILSKKIPVHWQLTSMLHVKQLRQLCLGSAETELKSSWRLGGEDSPGGQRSVTVRNHIDMAEDASDNSHTWRRLKK